MSKPPITGKVVWHEYANVWPVGSDYETSRIFGEAIDVVLEDAEGRLWAYSDSESQATQINFNPFTGEPAKTPISKVT